VSEALRYEQDNDIKLSERQISSEHRESRGRTLQEKSFVAPVDLFMRIGKLSKEDYEDWRFNRISHLEKVLHCNLSKANRILRILKCHAEAIGLKPSRTVYRKWGKGKKRITLRFSKFGEPNVELSYSTHYVVASMNRQEKPGTLPEKVEASDGLL
jgi:hypothetical protein